MTENSRPLRLGVVSFLNALPLIEGLQADRGVRILPDVPARLAARLQRGEFDVALLPLIDLLRSAGRYRVLSDACIGCDGETMTVRIFSQLPPDRIKRLWVDGESHTSVALAEILWQQIYDRVLTLETVNVRELDIGRLEAVLLIGDKVVDSRRAGFAYEVDLGGAWRQQTGLPFVFAVWACRRDRPPPPAAAEMLSRARDRGAGRAALIAETQGPGRGWPVALARRYLTRCLRYRLDARALEGANLFGRLCARCGFVPPQARIAWPQEPSLETV